MAALDTSIYLTPPYSITSGPFGAVAGLTPFRVEGGVIRVGTRALRVQADALVSAQ